MKINEDAVTPFMMSLKPKGPIPPPPKRCKKFERFEAITKEMADTYERKNHDYGDSFTQGCDRFGYAYALGRIFDKFNRIETLLSGKDAQVADEKITDTLTDMANYCIMYRIYLERKG